MIAGDQTHNCHVISKLMIVLEVFLATSIVIGSGCFPIGVDDKGGGGVFADPYCMCCGLFVRKVRTQFHSVALSASPRSLLISLEGMIVIVMIVRSCYK